MIAGVDGCKKGWIAAIEDSCGRLLLELFEEFAEILKHKELSHVVIDIPIGLLVASWRERKCVILSVPNVIGLDSTRE